MPDRLTADWPPTDRRLTIDRPPNRTATDRHHHQRYRYRRGAQGTADWPHTLTDRLTARLTQYRPPDWLLTAYLSTATDRLQGPPDRRLIDWLSTAPQSILIVSTHSANHAKKTRPQPGFLGIVYRLSIKHQKFDVVVCIVRLSVDCKVRQSPWIASTRHNRTGLTDSLISTP